ncbi:hypothetical protein P8452_68317 [Trifolium repens]|nr:hypothetical protein P8452_68317 [Trifolium repens]
MMDNLRKTLGSFAMVALLFVGFIFIYHWSFSSFSTQIRLSHNELPSQHQSNMSTNVNETYGDDLERALAKASMLIKPMP